MSVIFAGGELSSFTKFNAIETVLTNSFAYPARCGIHVQKAGWIKTDKLLGLSDFWIHADLYADKFTGTHTPISITNTSSVSLFSIDNLGVVRLGITPIGSISLFGAPGKHTLDIHLRAGSTGLVEIYADKQIMLSSVTNVDLGAIKSLILAPTGSDLTNDTNTVWSQVIIADEVTVGFKLATLEYQNTGTNNGWSGQVADLSEIQLNDNTFMSAPNAGLVQTWNTSDVGIEDSNIRAVVVSALAKYSTTGPQNLDAVCLIGSNIYAAPMTILGAGYTPAQAIFHADPTTYSAWDRTVVNAAEFGLRSKV